jgi:hypothetical protein
VNARPHGASRTLDGPVQAAVFGGGGEEEETSMMMVVVVVVLVTMMMMIGRPLCAALCNIKRCCRQCYVTLPLGVVGRDAATR